MPEQCEAPWTQVTAPFTPAQVQRLNEWQTNTGQGFLVHPFTCANRGDGKHQTAGGDRGILIATEAGWVCPDCEYTQDWAHAVMAENRLPLPPSIIAMMESGQDRAANLRRHISTYQAMAEQEMRGAQVMVDCLLKRQQEAEAKAKTDSVMATWTIYDHPLDFPDTYVARKWLVVSGNPEPQATTEALFDTDLDALRAKLPAGLVRIERNPEDDPVVMEVWM